MRYNSPFHPTHHGHQRTRPSPSSSTKNVPRTKKAPAPIVHRFHHRSHPNLQSPAVLHDRCFQHPPAILSPTIEHHSHCGPHQRKKHAPIHPYLASFGPRHHLQTIEVGAAAGRSSKNHASSSIKRGNRVFGPARHRFRRNTQAQFQTKHG